MDVVVATHEDEGRIASALTTAFADDAFLRWVFPSQEQFFTHFPQLVRIHARRVIPHGGARRTADFGGAALWFPPGVMPDRPALSDLFERALKTEDMDRLVPLLEQMEHYRPEAAHWYLRLIGVAPAVRGRGYGTRLIDQGLATCDRAGLPAYLEATGERNRSLYERCGFKVLGAIRTLDAPTLWPMLRPARPAVLEPVEGAGEMGR